MLEIAVSNYFLKQQAIIEENWQLAKANQDMNAIHDMRVGIKRLRTLYQFLDAISNGVFDYKLHFKELHQLFKAAGRLRDLQVQSHLFSTYQALYPEKDFIGFYQYLQQQHEQESKALEAVLFRFQAESLNDSLRDAQLFLKSLKAKKVWKAAFGLITKRLKQAYQLRKKAHKTDNAHKMRGRLKQLIYLLELLKILYGQESQFIKGRKRVKALTNKLGDWHDKELLLEQLDRFRNMCARQEIKPYRRLMKQLKKEVEIDLTKSLELMDEKPIVLLRPKFKELQSLSRAEY